LGKQLAVSEEYALCLQALYLLHAYRYDPLSGLSNARIDPMLHQIYVAHRVVSKLSPRMILADEVGLGKTIEAGLVIKELRARGVADRTLVICPANLTEQWRSELATKFNEEFEVFDSTAIKQYSKARRNPWTQRDSIICSLPFAVRNAQRILEADWDLVVFDEAHRVRRRRQGRKWHATKAYDLADELKEKVGGVLLLTATPLQLDVSELFSLIELVEPGLYPDFENYDMRRWMLPKLNEVMKLLQGWGSLTTSEQEQHASKIITILQEVQIPISVTLARLNDSSFREQLMDELVRKHPLAEVMVRNRRSEIRSGPSWKRVARKVLVEPTQEELDVYNDVSRYILYQYNQAQEEKQRAVGFLMVAYQKMLCSSAAAVQDSFRRRLKKLLAQSPQQKKPGDSARTSSVDLEEAREAEELSSVIEQLEPLFGAWDKSERLSAEIRALRNLIARLDAIQDSKAAKLVEIVKKTLEENPDEKILVFTQFIETQRYIANLLHEAGIRVSTFNGRMKPEDKERAVHEFRERCNVMVSTEAGGEGRNLQFCHIVLNYDLPWNPMRIEQRIGRVDRIGQKSPTVDIINLATARTIEQRVLEVLERRIRLFEESVGSLDPILGDVEQRIEDLVMRGADEAAFDELGTDLEKQVREALEKERALADFVMDRASLRLDRVNELLGRNPSARRTDLQTYFENAIEFYGGRMSQHPQGGLLISLTEPFARKLKLRNAQYRGVFNPDDSSITESYDFFGFGHPLVDALVSHPIDSKAVCGMRALPAEDLPKGTYVETFWELQSHGLRKSGTLIRHVCDSNGVLLSEPLRCLPPLGAYADVPMPEWVSEAIDASNRHVLDSDYEKEMASLKVEHASLQEEALRREERIFKYRKARLESKIKAQREWIQEKEATGTEKDLKVLPARKGLLEKEIARLEELQRTHADEVARIRSLRPNLQAQLVAVGLVVLR
jgi:superfamily II DNA or RNA helicase